jgi:glycosyltransferase involved in cell wall biosynthesis
VWKRLLKYKTKKSTDSLSYYLISLKEKRFYFSTKKILSKIPFAPDLFLYVHPHIFLCSRNLYELNKQTGAPIFNIPVDMAAFTGGCHYTNGCTRFESECGSCPGLYSSKKYDVTYKTLKYKSKYISQTEICLLANEWTLRQARKSSLYLSKPCFKLDIVINEKLFKPCDKTAVREKYNMPQDKSVILFGASNINEARKGFIYFQDALNELYQEMTEEEKNAIVVFIIGNSQENIKELIPFDSYLSGRIQPELLPEIYSLSDVYVSSSIQDAGPMMVVQSMMCGTPVVAFEMGNAEDFIVNGKTGYKVALHNAEELKNGIKLLLNKTKAEKKQISENCRNVALSKSSYAVFASRIMEIFVDGYLRNVI